MEERYNHLNPQERGLEGLDKLHGVPLTVRCLQAIPKVTANRISTTLEFNQPKYEERIRSGYSAIDHIHIVNQVIPKCAVYEQTVQATRQYTIITPPAS